MWKPLSLLLFISLCIYSKAQNPNDVIIDQLKMFVNGEEFFIKGMCYNPVPLGQASMGPQATGGGGYCSIKETPYGDYKSACYDSDYFDGSPGPLSRVPPPPPNGGWFNSLWERDFPYLQEMGVNTLRIYNANPTTELASIENKDIIPDPYGKNHTAFLDLAHTYGFKVIFPLIGDFTILMSVSDETFNEYLQWQIDEVGNHPAILMFTLGNELNLRESDQNLTDMINQRIQFARSYLMTKWNRKVPITSAVVDLPNSYNYLMTNLDVDVFTTNAGYRGGTFTDLFSGNSQTYGMWNLSCQTGKPIFIGEIGSETLNQAILSTDPNWWNQNFQDLLSHVDQGCIGGAFFEFSDEPLKADPLQQTMGTVKFVVDFASDGVNSTAPNAWNPDTLIVKAYFYSIANGTWENIPYNYNSDIFSLINRQAYGLGCAPSICSAYGVDMESSYTCGGGQPSTSGSGSSSGSTVAPTPTPSNPSTPTPTPSSNPSNPSPSPSPTPSSNNPTPSSTPSPTPSPSGSSESSHESDNHGSSSDNNKGSSSDNNNGSSSSPTPTPTSSPTSTPTNPPSTPQSSSSSGETHKSLGVKSVAENMLLCVTIAYAVLLFV